MALSENRILEWAHHPQTVGMMARIFRGPKSSLYRKIENLVKSKKLYEVGFYQNGRTKPEKVVSSWQVKSDNIEHEVGLTKMEHCWGIYGLRGLAVRQDIRPDMTIGKFHIELDRGTKDHQRLQQQLMQYEGLGEAVVVVVPTEARKKRILKECGFIANALLVGTVAEVMKPLCDVVLTCCDGSRHGLDKVYKRLGKGETESHEEGGLNA